MKLVAVYFIQLLHAMIHMHGNEHAIQKLRRGDAAEADGVDVVPGAVRRDAGHEQAGGAVEQRDGALAVVLALLGPQEGALEEVPPRVAVHGQQVPGVEVVLVGRVAALGDLAALVPAVEVDTGAAVREVGDGRRVEGHARDHVVAVHHPERLHGHVGAHVAREHLVAHARLPVGDHGEQAVQDAPLPVERQQRREDGRQRGAEAVAGDHDVGVRVLLQLLLDLLAQRVVGQRLARDGVGGGLGERPRGVLAVLLLQAQRLEEADVDVAQLAHAQPRQVYVRGPVPHVEGLRAPERHHHHARVLCLVGEHERLRRVVAHELVPAVVEPYEVELPDVVDDVLDVGGVLVGDLGGHHAHLEHGEGAEADEPPVHVLLLHQRHRRAAALHVQVVVIAAGSGGGGDAHHLQPPVLWAAAGWQRLQLRPPVDHPDHGPEVGRLPVQWDHQLTCPCICRPLAAINS
uniref:Uncharacterized protein n=1 Tax=Zea mays TaxID=4577 RepID=B7ZZC0_MAIZE|nr:unknown [Zea mays]